YAIPITALAPSAASAARRLNVVMKRPPGRLDHVAVVNEFRDQPFPRDYINRRKNSSLSLSPRTWRAATTPSAWMESAPVGTGGSLGRLLAKRTARTIAVTTATHSSTVAGIFPAMLHQPQLFPLHHVVIVLPPKLRHRLLCYLSG